MRQPREDALADRVGRQVTGVTFAALVAAYRASGEFRTIPSPKTRANRLRYLDLIASEHGHRSVKACRPSDVRKMRDVYADTPGKANNWLATFKVLMAFAALNDWRRDNPSTDVRLLPIGEHEPWPADILARALSLASPMLRLALITGLCSGARIGDVIRMRHDWHDGRTMQFTAAKNKAIVAVPMHPLWLEEIEKTPRRGVTLLFDRSGKPFSDPKIVQERVRRLMEDLGSPTYLSNGRPRGYSFHGLRKNAACYLKELGLNDDQIGSICGMTPDTVRHYTKRARALMVARTAADRITSGDVLLIGHASAASRGDGDP
ncbi:tyrosine-type recombinase/integrase [Sphingomonas sp. ac-8]|uniref:tyrosine-type recombinase/integrase n=1 Tax=Sphingomonas sp. ac-8 TaxID=3242977 RepID=UPI003A812A17